jgi:Holliday junction DNA helicase RuvA
MISKIHGTIDRITGIDVIIENSGIYYAVSMPPVQIDTISATHSVGDSILLFTRYYIEGGVGIGNLFPKLIGFLAESDREFFDIFTTVKGLGERKVLQAMTIPISEIAYAIESGDVATLKKLSGIGGRMGDKILAELKGKVSKFAAAAKDVKTVLHDFSGFEEEALEVLIGQLGYRRVEAENLISKARTQNESIDSVESLLQSIFKHKASVENA